MSYKTELTPKADKDLQDLPSSVRKAVARWIDLLEEDPYRTKTKKLQGFKKLLRVHVAKDYIIIYQVKRNKLLIARVRHRSEAYRGLTESP